MRRRLAGLSAAPGWAAPLGRTLALLLHLGLLALLIPFGSRRAMVPASDPATVEVEMVSQDDATKGAPDSSPEKPSPPAPPPSPAAAPAPPPAPPVPDAAKEDAAPPSRPATAAPARPPAPQPRPAAPAVNLGDADEDRDALLVTGPDVVPPRPDAAFHNQPPAYPQAAARRGREGTVAVMALVGTSGVPERVEVVRSSGDADLDRAAADAMALWRFQPARNNGRAVPFSYTMNFNFSLDPGGERGSAPGERRRR